MNKVPNNAPPRATPEMVGHVIAATTALVVCAHANRADGAPLVWVPVAVIDDLLELLLDIGVEVALARRKIEVIARSMER